MISKVEIERIGKQIVHSAFEVHTELGPGLLESVYEICLLIKQGIKRKINGYF